MIVYTYDETTGEYTGEHNCQPSPLEPGKYLKPSICTEAPPPKYTAGKYPFWTSGKWELRDDYRGRILYSTINGSKYVCESIYRPDEYTTDPRPEPYCKWDGKAWAIDSALKTEYDNAIIKAKLIEIDLISIRSIREYIASKNDAPQILKDHEASAKSERDKLK